MASKDRAQRIGIWIIAIVMTIGTLGSFVVIILGNDNQKADQARLSQLTAEYQTLSDARQVKVDAQTTELSTVYFTDFNQYAKLPAVFNKDDVKELKSEDLKIGTGAELTKESSFTAYYIGWTPDGKVFDGSVDGEKLKAPFTATPGGVIAGWTEGVVGMKVGGVRVLTIPADKAYGATGSGETIAPNTPLKFVMMVIPTPETIPQPEVSPELQRLYTASQAQ